MSLGRARELVGEDLQTIPYVSCRIKADRRYEFETYKKYSLAFYTILMGYADDLQAVSVDEALIDVTGAVAARELVPEEAEERVDDGEGHDQERRKPRDYAVEVAEKIRDDVRAETGCEGRFERCQADISLHRNLIQHSSGQARHTTCKTSWSLPSPRSRDFRVSGTSDRGGSPLYRLFNSEKD